MRWTAGMALTRPALTAHQSARRSMIFWSGEENTTFHGPVVTGQSLDRSKAVNVDQSVDWLKMCCGTMYKPRSYLYIIMYMNFGAGTLKFTTTVLSSVADASFKNVATSLPNLILAPCLADSVMVKTTSLALKGSPSLHWIPERVLMVRLVKSALYW